MKLFAWCFLAFLLTVKIALADTPPPGTVKIKDTAGNAINATAGAMDVNIAGGTCSVSGSVSVSNFPGTQPISAVSLPLPTGGSTSALQTTGNSSLARILSALGGTLTVDGSGVTQPVSIASPVPVTGTFWQATQPISAASLPLPAGAATAANQSTAQSSLSSIDSKLSGTLAVDGSGHTQPVSGTVTSRLQDGSGNAIGSTAGSLNVNITSGGGSNPSVGATGAAVPASANYLGVRDGSGNLMGLQGASGALKVDGSAVTQPVSASALPLPAGAATAAAQGTGNTSLASIDTKLSGTILVDASAHAQPVTGTFFQATQPVSAAALPLPAGASTAANQATANTSLASIDGKTPALGQATMAASTPVTIASDQSAIPITGSITATNSANGATGSAVPAQATQVAGSDGTNLRAIKVSAAGVVSVDASGSTVPVSGTFFQATQPVSAASLPLPSGAATSALQTSGNSSLSSIDSKVPANLTVSSTRLLVDGSGVTQPVSASSLPLPTGAATAANQSTGNTSLAAIQSSVAGTLLVDGSAHTQPVSGTVGISGTVPVSGTVTANAGSGTFIVDGSRVTQPVSAAALPLPAGAATSAKQPALGTAGSASADVISVQGVASMTALKVDGSAVTQPVSGTVSVSGTVPVSAASLPLPSGASTDASVTETHGSKAPGTAASKSELGGGVYNSGGVTLTTGQQAALQMNSAGGLVVDGSAVTQPVSAAALPLPSGASTAANQATANTSLSSIDSKVPSNLTVSSTRLLVDGSGVTQPVSGTVGISGTVPVSGTVTANIGTSGSLALDASVTGLQVSQGSTTSGQKGGLALGAVTTAAPSYTTAQSSPLSLTTAGALRTDASATTQPVSAASLPLPSGASTAAKQPALGTAGTASADVITVQGIASMTALKVDGSAVTQPVSIAAAVSTKAPVNTNGSMSTSTAVGSGAAVTLSVPANAVGFILEASSSNAQNIRWAVGTTPTTTSGLRLEPGRDTGYVPGAANVQVIAESGSSQEVQIQWILSQ